MNGSANGSLGVAVLVTAALGLAACTPQQPAPPPAPPAPTQLTIFAERGQSQAQQSRDRADCEALATRQATSSATWAATFSGCMSGRGYSVR